MGRGEGGYYKQKVAAASPCTVYPYSYTTVYTPFLDRKLEACLTARHTQHIHSTKGVNKTQQSLPVTPLFLLRLATSHERLGSPPLALNTSKVPIPRLMVRHRPYMGRCGLVYFLSGGGASG